MVEIKKVTTKKELSAFVQFYYDLYRGNDCAVPFLYFDEMDTLNSQKNPSFDYCEADYFLAYKDGKVVGRVAAIINRHANERWNTSQVRFGWFDFIDDQEVHVHIHTKTWQGFHSNLMERSNILQTSKS